MPVFSRRAFMQQARRAEFSSAGISSRLRSLVVLAAPSRGRSGPELAPDGLGSFPRSRHDCGERDERSPTEALARGPGLYFREQKERVGSPDRPARRPQERAADARRAQAAWQRADRQDKEGSRPEVRL